MNEVEEPVVKLNSINDENEKIFDIMETSILEKIGDTINMIQSLKKQMINGELYEWKRLQQISLFRFWNLQKYESTKPKKLNQKLNIVFKMLYLRLIITKESINVFEKYTYIIYILMFNK